MKLPFLMPFLPASRSAKEASWRISSLLLFCVMAATLGARAQSNSSASPFAVSNEAAFFQLLDLTRPELGAVSNAVHAANWAQAKEGWAAHLARRTRPAWLWSRRDKAQIVALYHERFDGLARYTNAANEVLARDFKLLGVRRQLAHKVEWLQGPVEWTHVLSRFHYWTDLGRAYWGTGDRAYAKDFVALLKDWVESNPVPEKVSNMRGKRGSVWRTLETGIRGQGWFDAMELFMDAPEFDAEAKYGMTKSLVEHAHYLAAWTTKYRAGNWQVCESSGLATIGIMLPEFKEAADWRKTGLDMLLEHMKRDVEDDGFHGELTPNYHRWVMMEFLHVVRLCELNGIPVGDFRARHEKMFEVFLKLRRPDGTFPPVGDAGRGDSSIANILGLGALIFDRPDFRQFATSSCLEDWVWLLGPDVCQRATGDRSTLPSFTSVLLPDSQYAIMRSGWGAQDKYLFFDCAPWRGAHSHQDRLQVTVFAGRDLLVDGGQISYDQPASKILRQSSAHNIVLIDGDEQLQADPKLLSWHTDAQADFASSLVETNGLRHQRSVLFVKPGYWVVVDHVSGAGEHTVTRRFQFVPGKVKTDKHGASTTFTDGMNIRVQAVDKAQLELVTGNVAATLTKVEETPVAALITKGKLPMTLCTVLLPFNKTEELPKVTQLSPANLNQARLRLVFPNGQRDEIVIAAEPVAMTVEGHETVAQAVCIRKGAVARTLIKIAGGISKPNEFNH
jgi:hypothetical protein